MTEKQVLKNLDKLNLETKIQSEEQYATCFVLPQGDGTYKLCRTLQTTGTNGKYPCWGITIQGAFPQVHKALSMETFTINHNTLVEAEKLHPKEYVNTIVKCMNYFYNLSERDYLSIYTEDNSIIK